MSGFNCCFLTCIQVSQEAGKLVWYSYLFKNSTVCGTSLAVKWLRLCASNARDAGSIPGQGTKILHATQPGQKKKKKNSTVCHDPYTVKDFSIVSEAEELDSTLSTGWQG